MDKTYKNWKEFYIERSAQIYEMRYSKELKKEDEERRNIQKSFINFLKERLSNADYEIAFNYINSILEKNSFITGLWNEKFYFSALKDAKKYEKL